MHNYPDYKIEKLNNFRDLFNRIKSFSSKIAFVNNGIEYTYEQFCFDVKKLMCVFTTGNTFVLINIKDKYLFSVAYFATVLSGNIACLQPYSVEKLACFTKINFCYEFNDKLVENILSNNDIGIAVYRTNEYISTVLCSSGTTAMPKAVALSQKNIITDLIAGMEKYRFADGGVYVSIIPYSHAFGLVCDLLGPLYSASTIYLTTDIMSFFVDIAKFNPTALNITPGLVEVLLRRIQAVGDKEKVVGSRLVKILSGGAATPASLCKKMNIYGINVYGCYGLSECAPCVCVNRDMYNKFGSAGIPLNCNRVYIESSGEIKIKGSNVMLGYLDDNGEIIDELHEEYTTGDMGYFDNDGFLYIIGRIDDVIVFPDGHKLMPQIIENELKALESVEESVVYLCDNKLATTIFTTERDKASIIEEYIRRNIFQGHKIVEINISFEPLERNTLGKLNRRKYGR